MKKLTSLLLTVIMLFSVFSITAYASTDNIADLKEQLTSYTNEMELTYIDYFMLTPPCLPQYSAESSKRMEDAIKKIRSEIDSYTTEEQINDATALLDSCKAQMYVQAKELKFMLDLMEADYNDTSYYDAETSAEIKSVYEAAKAAYESNVEKDIHISYLKMRDELNKLCLAVKVVGDVNNDGKLSIRDITIMQKYLAGSATLTSAQRFASGFDPLHNSITQITEFQKHINKNSTCSYIYDYVKGNIKDLADYYMVFYPDLEFFTPGFDGTESFNAMYSNTRYFNVCGPDAH